MYAAVHAIGRHYDQVYPSEYAYQRDSAYSYENISANCRQYPPSYATANVWSEDYIHCDGIPLILTDSNYGSEQYNTSEY